MVGIKPTRLWHLSPFKFYKRIIDDRILASKNHPHDQRGKLDVLLIYAVIVMAGKGFLYSYGVYEPKEVICSGPEPPAISGKNKKCPKKKGQQPCPEDEGMTVTPCPAETKIAEKKH